MLRIFPLSPVEKAHINFVLQNDFLGSFLVSFFVVVIAVAFFFFHVYVITILPLKFFLIVYF